MVTALLFVGTVEAARSGAQPALSPKHRQPGSPQVCASKVGEHCAVSWGMEEDPDEVGAVRGSVPEHGRDPWLPHAGGHRHALELPHLHRAEAPNQAECGRCRSGSLTSRLWIWRSWKRFPMPRLRPCISQGWQHPCMWLPILLVLASFWRAAKWRPEHRLASRVAG